MEFLRTRDQVEQGIRSGEHTGAQLSVSVNGETLLDTSTGMNEPFQPLEKEHLMLWLSACKPVAGVAMGILMDRDQIDLDQPVASWIPEFGTKRKDRITPRHLLTHTAGIRGATLGWTPRPWEEILGMICYSKPEPHWTPGEVAGYHVDSAWYLLGELVRLIDGRTYDVFVREEIFLPLGMNRCWVGIPDEVFEDWEDDIATMYDTSQGIPTEQEDLTRRESITCCRPGGNGRGPAREFLKLYESMYRMTQGEPGILKPETARDLVSYHRKGLFDKTFHQTMDWGLGFMRQSDHYAPGEVPYQFGSHASPHAFGHCGNQSTAAFCDPDRDLCAVVLLNGMPGEERHQARMRAILDALYEDLDAI
jgi:CubicO group peptidase (beta-lactamase class C family)